MRCRFLVSASILLLANAACAVDIKTRLGELKAVPATYVDEDACPFECCRYAEWTAREAMTMYSAPLGDKPVGKLAVGDKVEGLTGNVYSRPVKATVLLAKTDDTGNRFAKGETFFVLAPRGEGQFLAWSKGQLFEAPLFLDSSYESVSGPTDACKENPLEYCWYKAGGKLQSTWWVKVKTQAGLEGWIKESSLTKQDGCG